MRVLYFKELDRWFRSLMLPTLNPNRPPTPPSTSRAAAPSPPSQDVLETLFDPERASRALHKLGGLPHHRHNRFTYR